MAEVEAHGSTCEGVDAAMVEARAQAAFEHAERVRERLVLAVNGAELVVQSPAWGLGDTVRGMLSIRRFTLSFVPSADAVEGLGRAAEWLSQVTSDIHMHQVCRKLLQVMTIRNEFTKIAKNAQMTPSSFP